MSEQETVRAASRGFQLVVDNRVLLLGIDKHYRDGMKLFETKTLLSCAGAVANQLNVAEADVPVEGYYTESPELTRYFKIMRALQNVPDKNASQVKPLRQFHRIWEVANSPMYGRPQQTRGGRLMMLPTGRDPLSQALLETDSSNWNMSTLLEAGKRAALEYDDISLVGLAARAKDPVVLAALRESVILYAEKTLVIGGREEEDYEYVWRVDKELQLAANRFIDAFNNLVAAANLETELGSSDHESGVVTWYSTRPIPTAEPDHAAHFYTCCKDDEILGRCAHLGTRQDSGQKYHWAIRRGIPPSYVPVSDRKYDDAKYMWATHKAVPFDIDEFWSEDIWTTERYRSRVW